jgi:hypothetical protein
MPSSKESDMGPEPSSASNPAAQLGRRSQVGGGLAVFLGVLLLLATPRAAAGAPVNVHQMAVVFIAIGIFAAAAGTLARWYYLR